MRRPLQLRQHHAKVEQRECLAGEVRVGAEVRGEISLEMAPVDVEVLEHPLERGARQLLRVAEQLEAHTHAMAR